MERGRPTLPAIGELVLGKYKVIRQVGEGGMGVVFEALHERLEQRVALKLLRPEASASPEVVARFAREARAAGKLGSRHTARVIDIEEYQGLPIMVMEFLKGCDLSEELERGGALPVEEAVGYVLSTCVAMAEAHSLGIVHRDLKPSNLFLADEAGERVVKVLDFGISKMVESQDVHLTATSGALGTPLYMSPEQVRSAKKVDPRTDIWSLGVILYELLTNKLPFYGENGTAVVAAIVADDPPPIREIRPEVPEELAAVILAALAKKPENRPADIHAFMSMLRPFGPANSTGRYSIPQLPPPRAPRPSDPGIAMADTQLERASEPVLAPPAGGDGRASTQGSWSTQSSAKSRPRALMFLSAAGLVVVMGVVGTAIATRGKTTSTDTTGSVPVPSAEPKLPDPKTAEPKPAVSVAPPASAAVPEPVVSATAPAPTHPAALATAPKPPVKPSAPPPATIAKPPPTATATANPNRL